MGWYSDSVSKEDIFFRVVEGELVRYSKDITKLGIILRQQKEVELYYLTSKRTTKFTSFILFITPPDCKYSLALRTEGPIEVSPDVIECVLELCNPLIKQSKRKKRT